MLALFLEQDPILAYTVQPSAYTVRGHDGMKEMFVFSLAHAVGRNASRNRLLIIGSLTALCATLIGDVALQWYYIVESS